MKTSYFVSHTHHAGGVTDLVGKSKQVILYHTHHTGGVTDIVGYQNMLLWITSTFSGGVIPAEACETTFLYNLL